MHCTSEWGRKERVICLVNAWTCLSPSTFLFLSVFLENVGAICMIFCQLQKKNIAKYYNIAARSYYVLFSLRKWKRSSVIFIDVSFRHFVELYNVELTFIFQNILWIIQFYKKKVHNSGRVRSLSINNILTPLFAFRNYWQIIYTMRKLSENNKIVNICMVTNSRVWILITRKKCLRR